MMVKILLESVWVDEARHGDGGISLGSHSQYGHGDQAQHVGEHELLVDWEVEPGVVRQQVGAGQPVSFSRQEQGEDADEGGQAGHVVGVVAASLPAHQPGLRQLVAAREAGEDAQCLPLLAAQRGRLGRGRPGVESGEDVFLTQQLEQNIFNIKLYIIYYLNLCC